MPEVVVVGGGIAGVAAALAARAEGASVVLVAAAPGATAMAGGAWDVASDRAADPLVEPARPLDRALDALARRAPHHPLAALPRAEVLAAIRDAHAAVIGAMGLHRPLGDRADAEIVATELGLARRAALAQRAVLDLAPLARARIAVGWMRGLRGFDGPFIAASLNEQAVRAGDPRRFVAIEVELFRRGGDALLLPHEAAELLDAADARERATASIVRALGGTGLDAVLVPPILGLRDPMVREKIEGAIERPIGEAIEALAGGAQSLRTARALERALAGIETRAARVARIGERVELEDGEPIDAGAIVLATGKHAGGGVQIARGVPREPLAGAPIYLEARPLPAVSSAHGRDPVQLFGLDPRTPGDGFTLGVGWDASLRLLGAHQAPWRTPLYGAGDVLSGAAPHLSGLGTAATTGWLAGRSAARAARR